MHIHFSSDAGSCRSAYPIRISQTADKKKDAKRPLDEFHPVSLGCSYGKAGGKEVIQSIRVEFDNAVLLILDLNKRSLSLDDMKTDRGPVSYGSHDKDQCEYKNNLEIMKKKIQQLMDESPGLSDLGNMFIQLIDTELKSSHCPGIASR